MTKVGCPGSGTYSVCFPLHKDCAGYKACCTAGLGAGVVESIGIVTPVEVVSDIITSALSLTHLLGENR